jgi:Tol biopolymer transport system component
MFVKKTFAKLQLSMMITVLLFIVYGCSFLETKNLLPDNDLMATSAIPAEINTALTSTNDLPSFQPKGTIVFSDLHGLYVFDLKNNSREALLKDNSRIYENAVAIDDWVYFLGAAESKTDSSQPAGGGVGPFQLFKIHRDGSGLQQIIMDESINVLNFSVAPNEKYLSYSVDVKSSVSRYQLMLLDLEINKNSLLLESKTNNPFVSQTWSPNNEFLLYFNATFPGDIATPMLYDIFNNKEIELMLEGQIFNTRLTWSPDSREIVLGEQIDQASGVYFLDTKTKRVNLGTLTSSPPENLTWSPDGGKILFELQERSNSTIVISKLYLFDIKTKEMEQIAENKFSGKFFSYNTVWSPDGQYFAYFTRAEGREITLIIVNAQSLQRYENKFDGFYVDSASWVVDQ